MDNIFVIFDGHGYKTLGIPYRQHVLLLVYNRQHAGGTAEVETKRSSPGPYISRSTT